MYIPKSSVGSNSAKESRDGRLRINQRFPKLPTIRDCRVCESKFPSTGKTGDYCYQCYIKYLDDLANGTYQDREDAKYDRRRLHIMTNYIRRVLELQKQKIERNRNV